MPRPKRKKIKFDEDSVNDLLQEIYDESHNIRAQIRRLFTKWETKVKEGGEIAAIGDQVVKLIAAAAKNQDQKIMILKYLKEVVYAKNAQTTPGSEAEGDITSEDRLNILDDIQKAFEEKEKAKKK